MTNLSPVRLSLDRLEDRDVPSATVLDLTQRGSHGAVNGALFQQFESRPTGTGAIDSFVRVQAQGNKSVEQGYNTAARPLQYDENKSPQFTRSMKVADLPLVNVGGTLYREVLLDINQKASASQLSLDELRVYVGEAGNLTGYDPATHQLAGLTPVYDLDGAGDAWVRLDARLSNGSGSGDMLFLVPAAALDPNGFVYLYSKFGVNIAANGGFEEWAAGKGGVSVSPPPVAPQTASLSGTIRSDTEEGGGSEPVPGGTLQLWLNGEKVAQVDVGDGTMERGAEGTFAFVGLEVPAGGAVYELVLMDTLGVERALTTPTVPLNPGDNLSVDLHLAS